MSDKIKELQDKIKKMNEDLKALKKKEAAEELAKRVFWTEEYGWVQKRPCGLNSYVYTLAYDIGSRNTAYKLYDYSYESFFKPRDEQIYVKMVPMRESHYDLIGKKIFLSEDEAIEYAIKKATELGVENRIKNLIDCRNEGTT